MRALVCGSRSWLSVVLVFDRLQALPVETTVVHGACGIGADRLADWACEQLGLDVETFPADWKRYGAAAGHRRNAEMIATLAQDTDRVIAFRAPGHSPGTASTIRMARARRLVCEVIEP